MHVVTLEVSAAQAVLSGGPEGHRPIERDGPPLTPTSGKIRMGPLETEQTLQLFHCDRCPQQNITAGSSKRQETGGRAGPGPKAIALFFRFFYRVEKEKEVRRRRFHFQDFS